MTLTRKLQATDAWPDYARLPLPPGAEREQHGSIMAAGHAAAAQQPPVAEPSSPWHSTFKLADWADEHWAVEQARAAAAAAERQRYEELVAAQRATALARAHHLQQLAAAQQRPQGAATSAEADEFDMSLFKEATGVWLCCRAALAAPPLPAEPLSSCTRGGRQAALSMLGAPRRVGPCRPCALSVPSLLVMPQAVCLPRLWSRRRCCPTCCSPWETPRGLPLASHRCHRCLTSCQVCRACDGGDAVAVPLAG